MLGPNSHKSFHRGAFGFVALACSACSDSDVQALPPGEAPALAPSASTAPLFHASVADMVEIPAGLYPIGRNDRARSEQPRHEVQLAAFRVDRTEVTNAAFAEFLNALNLSVRGSFGIGAISARNADDRATLTLLTTSKGGSRPYAELDDNEARIVLVNGRFQPALGHADHPMTEVTWAGARAYCQWRGADLPTEAQWEAAARSKDDRLYPWGDETPDRTRVSASGRTGGTDPVGRLRAGASPFGLLDMAGSVAEWTRSLKRPYPYDANDGREDPSAPGERATRGGDYVYDRQAFNFSVSFRDGYSNEPEHGHRHLGFRCVD